MSAENDERKLFVQERQRRIVQELSSKAKVYVNDLSSEFGVTPATIRADLRQLEAEGLLRRCHGGALSLEEAPDYPEEDVDIRAARHANQKALIGAAAARFVDDGDALFIDSGTTMLAFAAELAGKRGLTVLTNDLGIAMTVERTVEGVCVIQLGGEVRVGFHTTQGPETVGMVQHYSAPKLFMSSDSFSPKRGFTTFIGEQVALKQALLEQSEAHYMLIDSSKINTSSVMRFAQLADYDYFITDEGIPDDVNLLITSMEDGPKLVIA